MIMRAQGFLPGLGRCKAIVALVLVPWLSAPAAEQVAVMDDEQISGFRETPDTGKYAVIITGAAATPEIAQRFAGWSAELHDLLRDEYGYQDEELLLLLGDGGQEGAAGERVVGDARKETIREEMAGLAERVESGDQISIYLIGHGSSRFGQAKFNNPGPDMTGSEFDDMLEPFGEQDLVVVNTTSASYPFSAALAAPGRVVVSATRSRAERYDPEFPRFWIEGLRGREADLDRNGRVSVLEAFNYARDSVAAWYEDDDRLATEHAVLDDSGDAMFTPEPQSSEADGTLAQIAYVGNMLATEQKRSAEARQLRAEMQSLERQVLLTRARKDDYLESEYWRRMESLLVELARKTRRYNEL